MCDLTGCDLQLAVFLSLLLFWCTKQQRTSPQTISPRSHHTPRRQQSLHARDDATFHTSATTVFTTRHSASTVRSQSMREGWRSGVAAAAISRPKRPRKPSRLKLIPLSTEVRRGRGRGGVSSPDWRVRDARRPKGGGARSKKGGGTSLKGRGQREVISLLFESLENQGVSEGLLVSDSEGSGLSLCSRFLVGGGSGRKSVFPRVTRSGAPAFSHPVRTEIAAQLERLPQKPVRTVGRTARETRGTSWSGHHAGGTRDCGRQSGMTRTREVTTSFFFGLCVNDCGWRQSS